MSLIKTIDAAARPSERLLRACAAFGLAVRHTPTNPDAGRPTCDALARDVLATLARLQARQQENKPDANQESQQDGKVQGARSTPTPHLATLTLITGPSGSGKSTLLACLAAHARRSSHTLLLADAAPATNPLDPHPPLIDLIDLPLPESLRTLAQAGLADATMLSRSCRQLSEGERFRLRLAQTMAATTRARPTTLTTKPTPTTLIIDEFASVLDRTTARCLSHALRRWLASQPPGLHVILATAHDDVRAWLDPDLTVTFSHTHQPTLEQRPTP